jgi:hypothetical protein
MKTILSALIALSILAGFAGTASALDPVWEQMERNLP